MSRRFTAGCSVAFLAAGLAGCMNPTQGDGSANDVSRAAASDPTQVAVRRDAQASHLIASLEARRSVLPPGSSYARVADAVLAANSRAAEAELRSARLRAEAASKNWLPSIGPDISLSSLGAFVAGLVVEQVLFDNGRKKAERAFARADVEVAAVALSEDTNDRVLQALGLYLRAEEGREKARLAEAALKDMGHFEWVMKERVKGGVSDMSDLNVTRQKLAELRATRNAAAEMTQTALAELSAMTALPLRGVTGLSKVALREAEPLAVIRAEAERDRAVAQAIIDRAGHLPGLRARGTLGKGGSGIGLDVGMERMLGLGTGASLRAVEATREAASRKVGEAREEATRRLRGQRAELKALDRQAQEARALSGQAKATLDLFQAQYRAGQRQVMDVVGVYETYVRLQQDQAALRYEAARKRLAIAGDLGLLADGSRI